MQGTCVHPHVAIHLAQWLSPRFAVRVSQWVYDWMTETGRQKAELPFHLRRYMANINNVPVGHFSALTEMTITLIAPLDALGYALRESLWPDISEGKMFANWLRQEYGIETNDLPSYKHEFEDGRRAVWARASQRPCCRISAETCGRFGFRTARCPTSASVILRHC